MGFFQAVLDFAGEWIESRGESVNPFCEFPGLVSHIIAQREADRIVDGLTGSSPTNRAQIFRTVYAETYWKVVGNDPDA